MYGDCQVMPTMGASVVVPSDSIFSSSPMQNPNFSFLPFHPFPSIIPKEEDCSMSMMGGKEEMLESGSGSDQVEERKSGNEQEHCTDEQPPPPKKKRYHRHTAHQIQEMEAMFKECPHPDDKQRLRLSQELGLKPRQVKFWFQNRRTQMKAQQDRAENVLLRAENDTLKNENYRLQAELRSLVCPTCGGPVVLGGIAFEELRIENARLREELERVCMASKFSGRQIQSMAPPAGPLSIPPPSLDLDMSIYSRHDYDHPQILMPTSSENGTIMPMHMLPEHACLFPENVFLMTEEDKALAHELAASSVSELVKMCTATEPLWIRNSCEKEVLDVEEYLKLFKWTKNDDSEIPKAREEEGKSQELMRTEASRHSCVVIMNSITLVDAFLDAVKWMELFPSVVARAITVQVLSPGDSGPSGCLLLMYAEFQVLSPLVGTREAYFFRYFQQNVEEGTWAIVDFPVQSFRESSGLEPPFLSHQYRRRPSGCLIQDMPNGYSKVTWVEHAEVEEKHVHQIFNQYVYSGTAFGAHRWLAVLQGQCQRVASLMARNITDLGVIPSPEARRNLMRLSQRMVRTFCVNISTSSGQSWTALSESPEDTVRFTTRKVAEPGQPHGLIFCAVSTTYLPYSHLQVFDLLRDDQRRFQIDTLSNGNSLHEVAHIANGSNPGNCISLLRVNVASNSSHHVELMLQESCTDESGSLVVYSTLDVDSIQLTMSGEDPTCIPLLPLGFSIIPVESDTAVAAGSDAGLVNKSENGCSSSGCLLTVGLQVLASPIPTAKVNFSSVSAINSHLCNTVHQISTALSNSFVAGNGVNDDENGGFSVAPPPMGSSEEPDVSG